MYTQDFHVSNAHAIRDLGVDFDTIYRLARGVMYVDGIFPHASSLKELFKKSPFQRN